MLRGIRNARDRALFWLIDDGGLRCQEALAINIEDIDWTERAIRIQGKGNRARENILLATRLPLPGGLPQAAR